MRILSYNISESEQWKIDRLFEIGADVYVVPEITCPEQAKLPDGYEMAWQGISWKFRGVDKWKGLGIIWGKGKGIVPDWYNPNLFNAIPLVMDDIIILAFWPTKRRGLTSDKLYPQIAQDIIAEYAPHFKGKKVLIIGDYNCYVNQCDNSEAYGDILRINKILEGYGLHSAYHQTTGEEFGSELIPTYYHGFKETSPFFLDYAYTNIEVTSYRLLPWDYNMSDHIGQVIELNIKPQHSMTTEFFKQLSLYYDNENDLSNITCAMCNSSMAFREKFIHFFFPNLDINTIRSIEREVCDDNDMHSRVDFLIRIKNDSKPYLIEVKIYDQNHHFGQYEAAYNVPKECLGYITNYYCSEGIDKGYDVKTWNDWTKQLEQEIATCDNEEDQFLIQGYIEYVNKICGFSNIISSLDFNTENDDNFKVIVKQALNGVTAPFNCESKMTLYEPQKHNVVTFYFFPDETKVLGGFCGYIGINGKPVICLGFCKSLPKSRSIYERLLSKGFCQGEWTDDIINMRYFSSPTIIVPMSSIKHKLFMKCKSRVEQSEMIAGFINYCLTNLFS